MHSGTKGKAGKETWCQADPAWNIGSPTDPLCGLGVSPWAELSLSPHLKMGVRMPPLKKCEDQTSFCWRKEGCCSFSPPSQSLPPQLLCAMAGTALCFPGFPLCQHGECAQNWKTLE